MLYRRVGKSDLVVSEVGLGTMTWGEQTSEQDAHAMLNLAVDEYGVNFVVRAPSEREGGEGKGHADRVDECNNLEPAWFQHGVYVV